MKIDDVINSKIASAKTRVSVNIRYTSNYLSGLQNQFMADYDLTMPQFNILRILRGANATLSVNTVKERMVEKSPNTTRLMDKLIDKGLITRERCNEDRRVVYVKISKSGLNLLSKIDEALEKTDIFPCHLTDDEANQLSDLLDKMRG